MPLLAQLCVVSSLVFFTLISCSPAGTPEEMALEAIKESYNSLAGIVLDNTATFDFGNKLVNRFLAKSNGKIKDLLNGKELDETMVKEFIDILDSCIENCQAFMVAVTPDAAKGQLGIVIQAVKVLKNVVNVQFEKMKKEKQNV